MLDRSHIVPRNPSGCLRAPDISGLDTMAYGALIDSGDAGCCSGISSYIHLALTRFNHSVPGSVSDNAAGIITSGHAALQNQVVDISVLCCPEKALVGSVYTQGQVADPVIAAVESSLKRSAGRTDGRPSGAAKIDIS